MQARITSAWNHDISTKKFIDKRKNGENVPTLEVVEVVSVHGMAYNEYQQKPDTLYTSTRNKLYVYLLNVKPNALVFWKINYTKFYDIIISFAHQNRRLLETQKTS